MQLKPGMKFGKLTTVARAGATRFKKAIWLCRCECGKTTNSIAGNLMSGGSKSCGCVGVAKIKQRNKESAKHGMGGTPEYDVWYGILSRCNDPKDTSFHNYGGRGIRVCKFISSHPKNLFKIVGSRPAFKKPRHYSIDRIENDEHYSCGKCSECIEHGWGMNLRWLTQKEQCRNTRHNRLVEIGGQVRCIAEWAEFAGLKQSTIRTRIELGWSKDKLLSPLIRK